MRYQFFLDARDYVKYLLLDDLMAQLSLRQLTLIWMLTPDAGNSHGGRRPKFDETKIDLNAFFTQPLRPNLWDVGEYFRGRGYICNSYGDRPDSYLTRSNRADYFRDVPLDALQDALVFLDPDNGVEPISAATTAHVQLEELRSLWKRMSPNSILVIYQHTPRVRRGVFWPAVVARVSEAINGHVDALLFGDVGFLVIARADLRKLLGHEGHRLRWVSQLGSSERGL